MSELGMPTKTVEQEAAAGAEAQVQSAGQMLRAAREASGLHIAALAVSMKVPVKKLEALEADRLDLLPDAVFVRALAASVCRTLKIEHAAVLERLPQNVVPRLDAEARSINAPFHSPGHPPVWTLSVLLKNPTLLAVVVLLIGALLVVFFPENSRTTEKVVDAPAIVVPAADAMFAATANVPMHLTSAPMDGVVSDAPSAPSSVPHTAEVSSGLVTGTVPTLGVLSFKQRGPSWVEVTDAKGVVQVRKTLVTGEVLSISGDLPLSVVVGRVDATDVEVRGKPFRLTEIAVDNVARFEVK